TVPAVIETSGEGLCCGYDSGLPVTEDYRAPFRFTGRIARVVVEVDGAEALDAEAEARSAMIEQGPRRAPDGRRPRLLGPDGDQQVARRIVAIGTDERPERVFDLSPRLLALGRAQLDHELPERRQRALFGMADRLGQ